MDKGGRLRDGNHRCGANLYFKIETLNAKVSQTFVQVPDNIDSYTELSIPSNLLNEILSRFHDIQQWLVNSGNTLACSAKGFKTEEEKIDFIKRFGLTSNILKINNIADEEIIIQFCVDNPMYKCISVNLTSKRCTKLQRIFSTHYHNLKIHVSNNCLEGKRIMMQAVNLSKENSEL